MHSLESQSSDGAVPYTGQHISLNLKDADIKDFFRLIHEISGLNLVIDPNVQGTVTMVLNDIPWDQALDLVLRNNQLGRQLEGNVVRIATIKTLQAEAAQQAQLIKAQEAAVPLQTEVKALSYAKAADLVTPLKQFLGSRDSITPEARTNTLLIQATPDKIPLLNKLIARLDQKTPQVEVEARVVAASRNFSRELGVQLGFGVANSTTAAGGVPGVGSSPTTVTGLIPKYPTTSGQIPFNVNLPATAPTSGLGFITATNSYRIDALLSAAEQKGLGHVLSRPKVITQNNAQAIVQQGVKIPVQTTINNTISVQFFNVTLRLAVTPQITADNTVFLQVDIENDQIDPGIPRIQGIPAIDTQQTTTNVLVQNGSTVVIGGVMINNSQNNVQQVPLLGSLPVIGNLFKHSSIQNNSQELLFFLTPRILKS
jgi:type IV pilus assembly protein PilQ